MLYTDLAVEAAELRTAGRTIPGKLDGAVTTHEEKDGFSADIVEILDEKGEKLLEKPKGKYITLDIRPALKPGSEVFRTACELLGEYLRALLPADGCALVAGLGNRAITPDAVGPACADAIFVTRHLRARMPELFGMFRPVMASAPGVLGTTGIETAEYLRALVHETKPDFVIAVDALMARRISRLGATVQLTDTGVSPGSGLGTNTAKLDRAYLGVPVIALGVPTIVDAATLAVDTMREAGFDVPDEDAVRANAKGMIVTSKDIDRESAVCARLLAFGINLALQSGMDFDALGAYLGAAGA